MERSRRRSWRTCWEFCRESGVTASEKAAFRGQRRGGFALKLERAGFDTQSWGGCAKCPRQRWGGFWRTAAETVAADDDGLRGSNVAGRLLR
jgi:hypothetical protein